MELNLDMAVFTTKYIIENNSSVVYVVHDHDGDWQFLGREEDINEKDGRIIALGEMINIDPSIKDILWLPSGMEARRSAIGDEWTTEVYSE